jgi:hypothetical protein
MDRNLLFHGRGAGYEAFFTRDSVIIQARGADPLALTFVGAKRGAKLEARRERLAKVNYLRGAEPRSWRTDIATYGEVVYRDLWPGVDLAFKADALSLKHEFVIRPDGRPETIRLSYRGAKEISVDEGGNLRIRTDHGVLTDQRPLAYQAIDGKHVSVDSRYAIEAREGRDPTYGFAIGSYDTRHPLVIDPELAYATFVGGSSSDGATRIAVDAEGNAYVTGWSDSPNFPATVGSSFQGGGCDGRYLGLRTCGDMFVAKLNSAGYLVYATFIGGSGVEVGEDIAVDTAGSAHVVGRTNSPGFPTTRSAVRRFISGTHDAVVMKLGPRGSSLLYSTYLGGSGLAGSDTPPIEERAGAVALDAGGNVYLSGWTNSTDFPTTSQAFQRTFQGGPLDGFVAMLTPARRGGLRLAYSSFLGGTGDDDALGGVAVDADFNLYVAGGTSSADLPATSGVVQPVIPSTFFTSYVAKLDISRPPSRQLVYLTFVGGSVADFISDLAVDGAGHAYAAGVAISPDFPVTPGAFDQAINENDGGSGIHDGFVLKLSPDASHYVYATYLGGTVDDDSFAIAVDSSGRAYVGGNTNASDFPTTADAFDRMFEGGDCSFFEEPRCEGTISRLSADGSTLEFSTFVSRGGRQSVTGLAAGPDGHVYAAGFTEATELLPAPAGFDVSYNGGPLDGFVMKILIP